MPRERLRVCLQDGLKLDLNRHLSQIRGAMTSERQAEANRQNAQKSTGPRTPAGKAVVALNGIKHGLLSRESLIKGESEAELVDFGKRLRAKLAPVGELELLFADRVISTAWRLRRVVAVETMHFNGEHSVDYAFNDCGREKMGVLSRYEMTLERSLYKALHELQRLQAARDGQAVPLPEAVDVDISISTPDEGHQMALLGESIGVASEGIKEPVSN
jgi:hypothetical protein